MDTLRAGSFDPIELLKAMAAVLPEFGTLFWIESLVKDDYKRKPCLSERLFACISPLTF